MASCVVVLMLLVKENTCNTCVAVLGLSNVCCCTATGNAIVLAVNGSLLDDAILISNIGELQYISGNVIMPI